ncbi:MAG: hypothetical protein L3K08_07460 [Thermoplasmata archaeon]|nr:hypothetical protein [Thermoplasmata archaeon]
MRTRTTVSKHLGPRPTRFAPSARAAGLLALVVVVLLAVPTGLAFGGLGPIGECWLQRMNLEEIRGKRPTGRLCRIDLSIGNPALWGHGYGTEIVGALAEF